MRKTSALFIALLIISLPIAIADETTQGRTDMPERPANCGNNNIDAGEECDPPFSMAVMGQKYNPESCIQKLKSEGKTEQQIEEEKHFNFITCSEQCTCKTEPKPTITPWNQTCNDQTTNQGCEQPISKCGNNALDTGELCDSTATNGVIKCEEQWKDILRRRIGYNEQELQEKLANEIDHFECSTQCDACTPIPKSITPPLPTTQSKCGNNQIDEGEDCDPPNTGKNNPKTIQQCKTSLFYIEEGDVQKVNNFLSKNDVFCETDPDTGDECICMYEEKQLGEIDCTQIEEVVKKTIKEYFPEDDEEKMKINCAMKEWIKQSIIELSEQCSLDIDKYLNQIDKKCEKYYKKQKEEISGIKKILNWISKGVSYLIPKWIKRVINWLRGGGTPCSNGTDRSILQHAGCSKEGQTCLYEPEISWTYAYQFYPIWLWDIILNKITGTDLSVYVWGRCDETCNCVKDDDYNNKVNEFIERFKQEIKEQEMLIN